MGQAGQADHRVAAPIGEPVVARDDAVRPAAVVEIPAHDELVGRQRQPRHPGRRRRCLASDRGALRGAITRGGVVPSLRSSGAEERKEFGFAGQGDRARHRVGRGAPARGGHELHRLTGGKDPRELPGQQVVLAVGQPALALLCEVEGPKRLGPNLRPRSAAHEMQVRPRTARPGDDEAVALCPDAGHRPAGEAAAVVVAEIGQGFQAQRQRPLRLDGAVFDAHDVGAVVHEHGLLDEEARPAESPGRHRAFELHGFEQGPSRRGDGAVVPADRRERHLAAVHRERLDQPGEHQRATDRRVQRRDEEAVVAARVHAGEAAAGVAADPVGQEPLPALERAEVGADFPPVAHHRKPARGQGQSRERRGAGRQRLRQGLVLEGAHQTSSQVRPATGRAGRNRCLRTAIASGHTIQASTLNVESRRSAAASDNRMQRP